MAIEVAQAYVSIIPSMKGIQSDIADALDADKVGSDAGNHIGEGISAGLSAKAVVIGNVITEAIRGAVTGAIDLGKSLASGIYDGFSANEQLVGGVERIFDQANISGILADAQSAYRNLNMSANDYLESINKVGATFAQTMGDQKGYDTAKKGMQAIADYASGTGADLDLLNEKYQMITRSTSSYQSIADQFAGILPQTSADFLKQAQAAGLLSGEYTKLTEVPVAEYQQAVTSMLEQGVDKMGLLGNTAAETAGTLAGSAAATKAAWENFLASIGTGDTSQVEQATSGLIDAVFGTLNEKTNEREGGLIANVVGLAERAFTALGQALPGMLDMALNALPPEIGGPLREMFETTATVVETVAPYVTSAIGMLVTAIGTIAPVVAPLLPLIIGALGAIKIVGVITSIVGAISGFIGVVTTAIGAISGIPALIGAIVAVLGGPVTIIAAIVGAIVAFIATNEKARTVVINVWNGIKASITTVVNAIRTVVIPIISAVVNGVVSRFRSLKSTVTSIFNSLKDAIVNPINTAKDKIQSAIDRIKSIVNNAHLKLPHFKLPHFRINGGKLPWGIGGKGSPPSIAVDWYAKGGFVDGATLIGAGEKGGELIWPGYAPYLDRYANAIASRMPSDNGALIAEVQALRSDIQNIRIYLDSGALVGGISGRMDSSLGRRQQYAGRGVM